MFFRFFFLFYSNQYWFGNGLKCWKCRERYRDYMFTSVFRDLSKYGEISSNLGQSLFRWTTHSYLMISLSELTHLS